MLDMKGLIIHIFLLLHLIFWFKYSYVYQNPAMGSEGKRETDITKSLSSGDVKAIPGIRGHA